MKTGRRRLAAFTVMAATMLLALVGVVTPAWAEEGPATPHLPVTGNKVTIASKLTMDENAMVPSVMFNYSIAPADSSECASTSGMPVTCGVLDAVSLSTDSLAPMTEIVEVISPSPPMDKDNLLTLQPTYCKY